MTPSWICLANMSKRIIVASKANFIFFSTPKTGVRSVAVARRKRDGFILLDMCVFLLEFDLVVEWMDGCCGVV